MDRVSTRFITIGFIVLAGCGPSLKHVTPDRPVYGQTVHVREFQTVTEPLVTDRPAGADQALLAQKIVSALREAGVNAVLASPPGSGAGLVIEGQITEANRGNRAERYVAGFSSGGEAGAARFGIKGRALRGDGTVIGEFSAKRHAGFGLFGGNADTLLNNCIDAAAYDVANMVVTGQYQDKPDEDVTQGNALIHP